MSWYDYPKAFRCDKIDKVYCKGVKFNVILNLPLKIKQGQEVFLIAVFLAAPIKNPRNVGMDLIEQVQDWFQSSKFITGHPCA